MRQGLAAAHRILAVPPAASPVFALTKWYMDLVTEEGVAVIAHSARLRWGAVRVGYSALLRGEPGRATEDVASARRSDPPRRGGELITWRCEPLALTGRWRREAEPIAATLLETPGGAIRWTCRVPRGGAQVEWRGKTHAGRGYAETLRLTVSPARLPFRRLRWGRLVTDGHSVVWIEWEGRSTCRWCWLDGAPRPEARLTESGVGLGDGAAVEFLESRPLVSRAPAAGLASLFPRLAERLFRETGGLREQRVLSRAALVPPGGEPGEAGWAIHEEVTW